VKHRSFRAILALLLVLAQAGLLLHGTDIAVHTDDSHSCEICLLGQCLDHALPGSDHVPPLESTASFRAASSARVTAVIQRLAFSPRAPPTQTFS